METSVWSLAHHLMTWNEQHVTFEEKTRAATALHTSSCTSYLKVLTYSPPFILRPLTFQKSLMSPHIKGFTCNNMQEHFGVMTQVPSEIEIRCTFGMAWTPIMLLLVG